MRLGLRCIAVGRVGLVSGALVLAGCVAAPAPYEYPLDGYYGHAHGYGRPYGAPPPGYYWWYPYQYGPAGYPPSIIVVRDEHWHGRPGQRPPEGDHDRHDDDKGSGDGREDRDGGDRDRDSVQPVPGRVPRSGERRPPPQVVPTDDSGQPERRRGRSRPPSTPPEE